VAMIITTLSAEHVLRYLLAIEGLEAPYGTLATTWPIFKQFLALPSDASEDIASFQLGHGEAEDPTYLHLTLARQVADAPGDYGIIKRSTQLTYSWQHSEPFGLEPAELWSDDFPDLAAFCTAVENHEAFRLLAELTPDESDVLVEEARSEDNAPDVV
jgi:hypothetical protein